MLPQEQALLVLVHRDGRRVGRGPDRLYRGHPPRQGRARLALRRCFRPESIPAAVGQGELSLRMNARAVAAWSASSLFVILSTTNPVYKVLVLVAAVSVL